MKKQILNILLLLATTMVAQNIKILQHDLPQSFRGLSVVNDTVVWVSGSQGTVGKSLNGGKSFEWFSVKGFENADFRDIEAFDDNTAVIMRIAAPAHILKTTDGGYTWKVVYENPSRGMFLDALDFYDTKAGIVIGDPINGKIFLAKTKDGGNTWNEMNTQHYPNLAEGEAFFASSGTNIKMLSRNKFLYVSGGMETHLFKGKKKFNSSFLQGYESNGANAVAVKDNNTWIVVGGDYTEKINHSFNNITVTYNGGKSFFVPVQKSSDYRSCVEYIDGNKWITCGLSGVDMSFDDGKNWQNISQEGFHVCKKAKNGKRVFLAGKGIIGILYD